MRKIGLRKYALSLAIAIKIFFALAVCLDYSSDGASLKLCLDKPINNDETRSAIVAYHYNNGRGFVYSKHEPYFNYSTDRPDYRETAYTPTFAIVLHIVYQRVYKSFAKLSEPDFRTYSSNYYKVYSRIINLLSLFLFLISIRSFKKIVQIISTNWKSSWMVTLAYILAPSSLIYVGLWVVYENIVLPLAVILLWRLIDLARNQNIYRSDYLIIPFITVLCTLLRPHTTLSFLLAFIVFLTWIIWNKYNYSILLNRPLKICLLVVVGMAFFQGLIAYKNYQLIGLPVISTQQANAFFLGHQPFTRGSWNGDSENFSSNVHKWRMKNIPNIDKINDEAVLYKVHKELAWKWVKENPRRLVWLECRKIAMFFLPYNFEHLKFNLFTFLMNLGFFGSFFLFGYRIITFKIPFEIILIYAFIIGGFILTIYSFFNHRFISYIIPSVILISFWTYFEVGKMLMSRLFVKP